MQLGKLLASARVFTDGDWVETKDQDPDGDARLTQLADVGVGTWRDRSARYMRSARAREMGCTFLEPSDVLVARMPEPLGRACLFPGDARPCVTAVDVCIIRPDPAVVSAKWLMWVLNAPQVRNQVVALQKGTTRKRISRKNLGTVLLRLPPRAEQDGIVAAIEEQFSRLDAGNDGLRAARERIAALRHLVLAAVVPETEKWVTTADVALVQGGIQKQPKRRPVENRYPFLRVANVGRNRLDLSEIHEVELFEGELERFRLQPGDLLVVEGNGSPDQIGRSALWRGEIPDCVHQNHLIRVRPSDEVDPDYLALYWNAPQTAVRLRQVASSTSGLYTLSTAKVKSIPVPIVTLDEQRDIVERTEQQLSVLDALGAAVDAAEARSGALRRAILGQAFAGRLVPHDPNDEPASELLARIAAERPAPPKARQRKRV
jgi:type I restriction enzyme S subunit